MIIHKRWEEIHAYLSPDLHIKDILLFQERRHSEKGSVSEGTMNFIQLLSRIKQSLKAKTGRGRIFTTRSVTNISNLSDLPFYRENWFSVWKLWKDKHKCTEDRKLCITDIMFSRKLYTDICFLWKNTVWNKPETLARQILTHFQIYRTEKALEIALVILSSSLIFKSTNFTSIAFYYN